jgi:hypothetical protein
MAIAISQFGTTILMNIVTKYSSGSFFLDQEGELGISDFIYDISFFLTA